MQAKFDPDLWGLSERISCLAESLGFELKFIVHLKNTFAFFMDCMNEVVIYSNFLDFLLTGWLYDFQEEYEAGDEMGKLGCEHRYHLECVNQWLRLKNWCPICKAAALPS